MAMKITVVLLAVLILPNINGFPLEEESSSVSYDSSTPKNLKVHPLAVLQNQNDNESSTDSPNSTEETYVEETYIEVLLPGVPQLNTSSLEAILNASSPHSDHNTTNSDRSKRGTGSSQAAQLNQESTSNETVKVPAVYTQQQEVSSRPVRDASEVASSTSANRPISDASSISKPVPALYSVSKSSDTRSVRDTSDESDGDNDSSSQESSEGTEATALVSRERRDAPRGNKPGTKKNSPSPNVEGGRPAIQKRI